MITVKEFEEIKERLITETVASLQQLGTQFGVEIGTRDIDHYISVAEYADQIRLSRQAIYDRIKAGTLLYKEVSNPPQNKPIRMVKAVEDSRWVKERAKGKDSKGTYILQRRYLINSSKENEKE